jgi:hypothetical protein
MSAQTLTGSFKHVNYTFLWPSGQNSRARFPALPDILRSSGSETGSTQSSEDN